MTPSPQHIKERLLGAVDKDARVLNMGEVLEVISLLEGTKVSKEALEETRLGKLVNQIRRNSKDEELKKRCRQLIVFWQKLFISQKQQGQGSGPVGGGNSEQQTNDSRPRDPAQPANDSRPAAGERNNRKRHIPESGQSNSQSAETGSRTKVGGRSTPSSPALNRKLAKGRGSEPPPTKPAANRLPESPVPAKRLKTPPNTLSPANVRRRAGPEVKGTVVGAEVKGGRELATSGRKLTPPATSKTEQPPRSSPPKTRPCRVTPPPSKPEPQRLTPPKPDPQRLTPPTALPGTGKSSASSPHSPFLAINGVPAGLTHSRLDTLTLPPLAKGTSVGGDRLPPDPDKSQVPCAADPCGLDVTDDGGGGSPLEPPSPQRNGHHSDEGGSGDAPPLSPPRVVTRGDLERLGEGQWDGVNGCYGIDDRQVWTQWQDTATHLHPDGTALYILPYVCLD